MSGPKNTTQPNPKKKSAQKGELPKGVNQSDLSNAQRIGSTRAKFAIMSCWALVAISAFNMGVMVWMSNLPSLKDYLSHKEFAAYVAAPVVIVHVACIVLFLMWVYMAHKNLTYLGETNLRFTPKWAVASFLVPILFFFMPYQIMNEIWDHSLEEKDRINESGLKKESYLIKIWWLLFLSSWLLPAILNQGIHHNFGMEHYDVTNLVSAVGVFLQIIGIIFGIRIIAFIEKSQFNRFNGMLRPAFRNKK